MKQVPQPFIVRMAAGLVIVAIIVVALYYLRIVLVPLLFSIIFAVMIFPLCLRFEKWGLSKGTASFFSVLIFSGVFGFLIYLIYAQIGIFSDHIPQISSKLNALITELRDFLATKFSMKKSVAANKIQEQLTILQNSSTSGLSLNSLSSFLINLFLIPLYVYFIIYYRHFFIEFFYKLFPGSRKELIDETLEKMNTVIKGYLFGQLLDILIIGTANSIALLLIGVGYPIVLGFVIATLCIIPYLGMIVGSLAALLVALITTDTSWQPITAFSLLWVIHIIDSNLVTPLVIGSRVSLNPLMAIFVLFLFGELWGLPGLFLALPLTAIVKIVLDTIPGLQPYGFLLGQPEKYHLKKHSYLHIKVLHRLIRQKETPAAVPGNLEEKNP